MPRIIVTADPAEARDGWTRREQAGAASRGQKFATANPSFDGSEVRGRSAFVFARREEMAEEATGDEKDDAGCST